MKGSVTCNVYIEATYNIFPDDNCETINEARSSAKIELESRLGQALHTDDRRFSNLEAKIDVEYFDD